MVERIPSGKPEKKCSDLWKRPQSVPFRSLNTGESFPGKKFAIKGANWLNAGMRTNFSSEQRKVFARRCFDKAIGTCISRINAETTRGRTEEAGRLVEIVEWLKGYKNSI